MTSIVKFQSKSRTFSQILVKSDFHQTITIQSRDFSLLQSFTLISSCCCTSPYFSITNNILRHLNRSCGDRLLKNLSKQKIMISVISGSGSRGDTGLPLHCIFAFFVKQSAATVRSVSIENQNEEQIE